MPPPTGLGRILVVRHFACPTNWWRLVELLSWLREEFPPAQPRHDDINVAQEATASSNGKKYQVSMQP